MAFGVPIERRKHDGEDAGSVVTDQAHDVLIVPVVEGALCHLGGQWSQRHSAQSSRPAPSNLESVGVVLPGNGGGEEKPVSSSLYLFVPFCSVYFGIICYRNLGTPGKGQSQDVSWSLQPDPESCLATGQGWCRPVPGGSRDCFPVLSGQGVPVDFRKSHNLFVVTVLRSQRVSGGGGHGLGSWGCLTAVSGR